MSCCIAPRSLADAQLDDLSLSVLSKANWPKLVTIQQSNNCFGAQGTADLVKADFPFLQTLHLQKMYLDPLALRHLQQSHWPNLMTIQLSYDLICLIESGSGKLLIPLIPFQQAQWPRLQSLTVQTNFSIDATLVTALLEAEWPLLHTLRIIGNILMAQAAAELSLGSWPSLKRIRLDVFHGMSEEIAKSLVLGKWPELHELTLAQVVCRVY